MKLETLLSYFEFSIKFVDKKGNGHWSMVSFYFQKKRLMVWFVSHCNTHSRRQEYAHALSNYIRLDRYGDCAQEVACGDHRTVNCKNVSLQDYKFYFAAENALCKDYFTGKM